MGLKKGRYCTYISPVTSFLIRHGPGDDICCKIIGEYLTCFNQIRYYMGTKIMLFFSLCLRQCFQKHISVKYIIRHGNIRTAGVIRPRGRLFWFFLKSDNSFFAVSHNNPKRSRLLNGDRPCSNSNKGIIFKMEIHHLTNIHSVYMVSAEDYNELWIVLADEVNILKNRISRALKPFGPHPHLWWNHSHKMVFDNRRKPSSFTH